MASRLVKVTVFSKELAYVAADRFVEALSKKCPGAQIKFVSKTVAEYNQFAKSPAKYSDEVVKALQDAEVIVTDPWLVFPIMDKLPNLKWVQGSWAGIDGIYKVCDQSKLPPPFIYTRLGGSLTYQLAEYVMSYILSIERHTIRLHKAQEDKTWGLGEQITYRKLSDLTVGILGVGDIGSEVARVVKTFGMKTWGLVNRDLPKDQRSSNIDEYRLVSGLPEILANCDYLCNVLPSTSKTKGILSGDALAHCKKKPVFINIGRGDVTTEDSIINAIKNGWISKAVLDVFEKEPLPKDSLLWTMPEVIITPHCGGLTLDYSIAETFADNYQRYISGKPLKYVIEDWARGY
ncbi:uncharacterized protein in proB 3'region-like isoform X2 [Amphiura filiformis]|uniref:uncharacterized protein in proB 3'region-like isoform X2 n=1 Tax=Amphiura filiformis TaxID=82378 RepID=UPI003B21489D